MSFFSNGQITREQAISIVINDVVSPDSLQYHHLYSKYESMELGETLILEDFDSIPVLYGSNWVFFIDLMPVANWAHPCQYVFVDISSGDYSLYDKMMPPVPFFSDINEFFTEWEWILSVNTNNEIKSNKDNFSIGPNPFNNVVNVRFNNIGMVSINIQVVDILGKQVINTNYMNSSSGEGTFEMDSRELKPGIFFIQITRDNSIVYQKKIIKKGF
jgi:hypothetical protein